MVDFAEIIGFEWDDNNTAKNWQNHQVLPSECEEVFFNLPLILADDEAHSQKETRFYVLGQTQNQRRLFIAFTVRKKKIRVISARDMSRKERKVYEQGNS
ncbi:MAG TPA: BrnT family toxin [Anaerolineales bacterium]|nr:BrnT family toxin [Anaerolineales bacterium]HRQ92116.1 BrnT family toxin [Anaerolineales bacterium]